MQQQSQYENQKTPTSYWSAYGGWRALVKSPIFWISMTLSAICYQIWIRENWWDSVTSLLPNILGFSIGAFAIFLGLGNDRFKDAMHKNRTNKIPLYLKISAIFVHQILIQTSAVVIAIVANALYHISAPDWFDGPNQWIRPIFWAFCYFLFIYSILLVVSTALNIFVVARLLNISEIKSALAKDRSV